MHSFNSVIGAVPIAFWGVKSLISTQNLQLRVNHTCDDAVHCVVMCSV